MARRGFFSIARSGHPERRCRSFAVAGRRSLTRRLLPRAPIRPRPTRTGVEGPAGAGASTSVHAATRAVHGARGRDVPRTVLGSIRRRDGRLQEKAEEIRDEFDGPRIQLSVLHVPLVAEGRRGLIRDGVGAFRSLRDAHAGTAPQASVKIALGPSVTLAAVLGARLRGVRAHLVAFERQPVSDGCDVRGNATARPKSERGDEQRAHGSSHRATGVPSLHDDDCGEMEALSSQRARGHVRIRGGRRARAATALCAAGTGAAVGGTTWLAGCACWPS